MISYKYFSEDKNYPLPSKKEQDKNCPLFLPNRINNRVDLVAAQLEETRTFKKALLQKLFPN